ncbi:MAG: hypothetical protein ABI581_09775 [Sediminibacterium sp.]
MKKLFILALIAIATGTSAFAGTSNATTSNSNGKFEKVTSVLNNETITAFYNEDGELVGTSKKVSFDKLPKAALETITTQYTFPEYQILECIEFTNDRSEKEYFTSFSTEDTIVVLEILENGRVSVFSETEN